jgi:hypothetical protein
VPYVSDMFCTYQTLPYDRYILTWLYNTMQYETCDKKTKETVLGVLNFFQLQYKKYEVSHSILSEKRSYLR